MNLSSQLLDTVKHIAGNAILILGFVLLLLSIILILNPHIGHALLAYANKNSSQETALMFYSDSSTSTSALAVQPTTDVPVAGGCSCPSCCQAPIN